MTRFDEVTRLRELEKKAMPAPWAIKTPEHNDGYQETWIVGPGETGVMPIFDDEDDHLNVAMRNASPWLLEAAACFQPGDARCVKAILGIIRAATGPETDSDELDCLRRLQKAAEIMEDE
jgi:hypothetical protein